MLDVLDEAITGKGLVAAFQPVVELPSRLVVGYEALARWPALNYPAPIDILSRAERTGRLNALDQACIRAAVRGALSGLSAPGMLLLVNCEPATAHVDPSHDTDLSSAATRFRFTFELTERGLLTHPRALLRKVAALRSSGFAIALDDIGPHADSMALLDVLAPDILKLDMGLIHRQPDRIQARTIAAIIGHQERTGAVICAEGIETHEHLEQALAYGATLGQGHLFGVPGELTTPAAAFSWPTDPRTSGGPSAVDAATAGLKTRIVREQTVSELYRHIERIAATADSPPMLLVTLRGDESLYATTHDRYATIAERSPLVAVFGRNPPVVPGSRIRMVTLEPGDPLLGQSVILVLGPDTAAGLIARDLDHSSGRSRDRRFEMAITFDREHVTRAVTELLDRMV